MNRYLNLRTPVRLFVFVGVSLVAATLSVLHPRLDLDAVYRDLSSSANTWLTVHVLQLFLFALLAVLAALLLDGEGSRAASVSRLAMAGFAVFYGAFDGLAGIATGVLVRDAHTLSADQQAVLAPAIERYFLSMEKGVFSWIGVLGTFFWVTGLLAAAIALARPRYPGPSLGIALLSAFVLTVGNDILWQPFGIVGAALLVPTIAAISVGTHLPRGIVVLLGISALFLTSGHRVPFGTIAFASFGIAAVWMEVIRWRQRRSTERLARNSPHGSAVTIESHGGS